MQKRRIVLCRHTQTLHNVKRIYTGQMDIPVDSTGASQALRLSQKIAKLEGLCGIVSSDLKRTMHLAKAIGRRTGLRVHDTRALREASVGEMEGLDKPEAVHRWPNPTFRTSNPQFDFRSIGGERASDVVARQIKALRGAEGLFGNRNGEISRLVVVGHGTALRLLFLHHLGVITQLHEQGQYQEFDWPF